MIKKNKMTQLLASVIVGVVIILCTLLILLFTGVLNPQKTDLTIVTGSSEALYDGNPLTSHSWQISEGTLKGGHQIEVIFTSQQTSVGESDNIATVKITDEVGADVTKDYRITYRYGTLKINPRVFRIESAAATKEYDEKPLRDPNYTVVADYIALADGHKLVVEVTGEITEIGATTNTIETFIIVDAKGNDISYNYHVSTKEGILQVVPKTNKIKLTISSGSARKVYDGKVLTNNSYQIISGDLDPDHTIFPTFTGEQTSAGESRNFMSVKMIDEKGRDVTDEYAVTYDFGLLQVDPRPIRIDSASTTKTYDGQPLKNSSYTLTTGSNSLVSGDNLEVRVVASITDVGKIPNTVSSVKVVDKNKVDVTRNYQITIYEGALEIEPRPLYIASASAEKAYDGKPLTDKNYTIISGEDSLVKGHTLQVSITGSITDPGIALNTISQVRVYNSNKNNVTHNYELIISEGILEVLVPGSHGSLSNSGEDPNMLIMELYSTVSSIVYLREKSFGDYNGNSWSEAEPYTVLLNNTYSMQYLSGVALQNSGIATATARAKLHVPGMYLLPYFLSLHKTAYQIQTSDTFCYAADNPTEYELLYYPVTEGYEQYKGKISPYATQENAYSKFVYSQYLTVDPQTKAYMTQLIQEQGFRLSDPDIIQKTAADIQNAAVYNLNYPSEMDDSENPVIAFLDVYKQGVCRHYASAATLLFRTLGIPARYTVGFMAATQADEWIEVRTPGHAWVEIYIEDFGWIPVEVTGSNSGGGEGDSDCTCEGECNCEGGGDEGSEGGSESKMKISLTPVRVSKLYDGKPLYASSVLNGLEKLEKMGYTYQAVVTGERTELGITESVIEQISIFDSQGNDVTNSFNIEKKTGEVQIYHTALTFESYNVQKIYDGSNQIFTNLIQGALKDGHTYTLTPAASTVVGKQENLFDVCIFDENGNDMTSHYFIQKVCGILDIMPRQLVIQAGDAQKVYDGKPLICDELSILEGTLVEGHQIADYTINGMQTQIGRSDNVITQIIICDKQGNDVTANYQIVLYPGTLRVTMQ